MAVKQLATGYWRVSLSRFSWAQIPPRTVTPGDLIPIEYIFQGTKDKQFSLSIEWYEYCIDNNLDNP